MMRLLTRLGFRPYPDPPPVRAAPRISERGADTLAMYAAALALMTAVVAAKPLALGGDDGADTTRG